MVHRPLVVIVALLLVPIAGCADTRGPELVVNSHIAYNNAVSQVLKQELLLNVVRRRYMEAPQFMNVSSINSNISTSTSVGAGADVADIGNANVVGATVDGSLVFTDSPTITITPRQGEDIASQLHEPLNVSVIADLVSAGYPVYGAFRILVEGANNLHGPDLRFDRFRPPSSDWREAMALMAKLYDDGSLVVDRFKWNDPYNDYPYPAESITPQMWITTLTSGQHRWKSYDDGATFFYTTNEMAAAMWLDPQARQTADGQRLMALLNVQPDVPKKVWLLESARVIQGADFEGKPDRRRPTLKLRMRSLYNVLNFFSYGVQVPPEHEEEGRASDLSTFRGAIESGEMVDITDEFQIRYSERPPEAPFYAVKHRGLWFYIDDRDFKSKAAFNSLYDLWQLSIKAPSSESQPVTTIQVN